MADSRISALTALTNAGLATDDVLPIVDTSAVQTKKIAISELDSRYLQSASIDTSAELAAIVTDETGTGSLVFANTPTLVTPILGTPTSGTLTNCTGLPISSGVSGLAANVATFLGTPSSANLASAVTDETGTGALVFANTPTLVTPLLGTPTSGNLSNCTSLPISTGVSGLGTGVATFLGTPSSANLASAVTDETGTGSLVFGTAPTLASTVTIGTAGGTTGAALFKGTTSGTVTLSVADAAGTWTMKLPTSAGTSNYFLQTDGLGNTSWASAAITPPLNLDLGSVSAPTYSFTGDTNTGMYSSGADTLCFATAGALALNVDSTGKVTSGASALTDAQFNVLITNNTNAPIASFKNAQGSGSARDAFVQFRLNTDCWSVGHDANSNTFRITNATSMSAAYGLQIAGGATPTVAITGHLGIGTASPGVTYTDRTASIKTSSTGTGALELIGSRTTNAFVGIVDFYNTTSNRLGSIGVSRSGADNSGSIDFYTANAGSVSEKFHITHDGRIYGLGIHNNGGSMTGATNQYIGSGTYTPTSSNLVNATSPTIYQAQWMRVGNVVTISGAILWTITSDGLNTQIQLSLPIATTFTSDKSAGGTCCTDGGKTTLKIIANTSNHTIQFSGTSNGAGSQNATYIVTYLVES